jgi:hypothetical protein
METGIEDYAGEWDDECGHRLSIKKLDDKTASVSLFMNNQAIARRWFEDKPSTDMIGIYDPWEASELVVELWEQGKGFSLHLNFESQHELDKYSRDSLSVALSRFEKDDFLDEYYSLFGPLRHYVRSACALPKSK